MLPIYQVLILVVLCGVVSTAYGAAYHLIGTRFEFYHTSKVALGAAVLLAILAWRIPSASVYLGAVSISLFTSCALEVGLRAGRWYSGWRAVMWPPQIQPGEDLTDDDAPPSSRVAEVLN